MQCNCNNVTSHGRMTRHSLGCKAPLFGMAFAALVCAVSELSLPDVGSSLFMIHSAALCLQMVAKAGVPNYLVVAIDTKLRDYLVSKGYNVYYRDISVGPLPSLAKIFMTMPGCPALLALYSFHSTGSS